MSHIVPELEENLTPVTLPTPLPDPPERHGHHLPGGSIAAAAAVLMAGTLLSRVLGLAREQIAAYLFGAGNTIAAFTIADNIHTISSTSS